MDNPTGHTPWELSMASLILVGFATNEFDCTLAGYLTDSYTIFSASAFASLAFLRAIISGSLPLFTNQMYAGLGANKATTILAATATAFCAAPLLFLKYGEKLREKSAFARYSREAEAKMGSVAKEDITEERGKRADAGLELSNETLVEDEQRGDVEAVTADLAGRGETRGGVPERVVRNQTYTAAVSEST
jgi:hypothetical protein